MNAVRNVAGVGCANPNALGVTRTVEIDTTGGPGFGFEHFKMHDFLRANDLEATKDFYCRVLGFEVMPRPNFPFPGYWLGQSVHCSPAVVVTIVTRPRPYSLAR